MMLKAVRIAARLLAIASLAITLLAHGSAAWAQATQTQQTAPPPQVEQLLKLLRDPAVRTWIEQQGQQAPPAHQMSMADAMSSKMMAQKITGFRAHLHELAAGIPQLGEALGNTTHGLMMELEGRGLFSIVVLAGGFMLLGAGSAWLFAIATSGLRRRILALPVASVADRLRLIGLRLGMEAVTVLIFAFGSVGAFLIFTWPPLLRQVIIGYLAAAVFLWIILATLRSLLALDIRHDEAAVERCRILPIDTDEARHVFRRLAVLIGVFVLGWTSVDILDDLGLSRVPHALLAYTLGLIPLVVALDILWQRPSARRARETAVGKNHRSMQTAASALTSIYLILLWGLWVGGLMGLFWLGAVALLLPVTISVTDSASRHVTRPVGGEDEMREPDLTAVFLGRGIRALLIGGAALLLADVWRVNLVMMASTDTLTTRFLRGALSSIVILLAADLIWQIIKTTIDRKLAHARRAGEPGSEEALRQARLMTLLPIFRNVSFAVLGVVAMLMILSALGVDIGPLVAGAGIAGIAVGFGAQTLVKDIISGIFYLLDDAFRIGEYIQSGSYKGTVEAFGFRSIKLRHHRGPIYTVPFGELGAVQNMSRDWVIDKLTINVTYDTDLEKARKLVKKLGQELAADPEYAPHIIEPLKMQGVEQFGDFAIQLRMKMMTRPGEQFVIRRRAYALIKKAFDENGIKFAFPTVQVAGDTGAGDDAQTAAARQSLAMLEAKTAEAAKAG